jgi:5-methylcytosine-specific restriction endonuclease McrA
MTTHALDLNSFKTLKLDASFNPVAVIPAHEALVDTILGKAVVLETYDRLIQSPTETWQLPAVIVLRKVIKHFLGHLQCCRKYIYVRDQGECQYCGIDLVSSQGTVDHILPKSRGGGWSWENLVLACMKCNQSKGSKTPKEAGMKLRNQPKKLTYREYVNLTDKKNTKIWKQYL